jgi:hypothetical protein
VQHPVRCRIRQVGRVENLREPVRASVRRIDFLPRRPRRAPAHRRAGLSRAK